MYGLKLKEGSLLSYIAFHYIISYLTAAFAHSIYYKALLRLRNITQAESRTSVHERAYQ